MRKEGRIRLLTGEECLEAQGLWRQVFSEDTATFTDYYFSCKAGKNRGLVLEGQEGIRAMLYLTPERVCAAGRLVDSAYIVGVATRPDCRRKGYMSALLKEALALLYRENVPFVFLMPASPAIYAPFDFVWIYDRPVWDAAAFDPHGLRRMKEADAGRMAQFASRILEREKEVYVLRDSAYYREKLQEAAAQEGGIFGYERQVSPGAKKLEGLFYYTREEGEADLPEVLAEAEIERCFVGKRLGEKPAIMARVVKAEALLSLLSGDLPVEFGLQIKDPLICQNSGRYLCRADRQGCVAKRMSEKGSSPGQTAELCLSAGELTEFVFGRRKEAGLGGGNLRFLSRVWINEIV